MFTINKKTADPVVELKAQSEKIVSVFTQTITDLKAVNQEIDANMNERNTKIEFLNKEVETLGAIQTENLKVISKISQIFE